MSSIWGVRPNWPPSPSVEDESESLAHELNGTATLAEKPGEEGVCVRGTIDQYPIILSMEMVQSTATECNASDTSSVEAMSSSDSQGPATPPPILKDEPAFHHVDDSPLSSASTVRAQNFANVPATDRHGSLARIETGKQKGSHPVDDEVVSCQRGDASPRVLEPSPEYVLSPEITVQRSLVNVQELERQALEQSSTWDFPDIVERRPPPKRNSPKIHRGHSDQVVYHQRRGMSSTRPGRDQGWSYEPRSDRPKSEEFTDLKHGNKLLPYPLIPDEPRRGSPLKYDYYSDTGVAHDIAHDSHDRRQKAISGEGHFRSRRRRSAVPESARAGSSSPDSTGTSSTWDAPGYFEISPSRSTVTESPAIYDEGRPVKHQKHGAGYYSNVPLPASAPQSPLQRPCVPRAYSQLAPHLQCLTSAASPPPSGKREIVTSSPKSASQNTCVALAPVQEPSRSSSRRRRTVSFSQDPVQASSSSQRVSRSRAPSKARSSRQSSPCKELVVRRSSPEPGSLCLLPCPRSVSMAGYQDWYTIRGLTHLDICPSCMKQMAKSKFRDFFIPSLPKPRGQMVRCSMSEPWARLAWLQTIKQGYNDLETLYQVTRSSPGVKPCAGRTASIQSWYKVIDPETGSSLPRFNACQACVRNIRILMPAHRDSFKCSTLVQERICDLATESPRFVQYIDLLDAAANEYEYKRLPSPDMQAFVDYARRKTSFHHCRRDRLILSTWHYIPELPEFSICEDCYDDVVRPLAKAQKPIARMVSRTMRLLPGYGPNLCREASCQLYSPRMRTRFREAVQNNDYSYLKLAALKRYEAELRFRERKAKLLADERKGYDCDTELRTNAEEWKKWE
ncbi:conserved hypothetical protein [Paecilomyces variotii No. 5]|uniref:Ser arg-related nuclear matrix protein n=1 Tax=Byssochlamys spectabilis (strain No. 5 / NBRC 109023) TaxID=1356009 RepID=V5I2J0_BYSSN|nr:conserved hypothetical protein [Paecilomyces variotii No. 5]